MDAVPFDSRSNDLLSDTIGQIYECALEPALWTATLKLIVERFAPTGWHTAMLVESRQNPGSGQFFGVTGLNDKDQQLYLERFAGRNPWTKRFMAAPMATLIDSDELMPRSELMESPFYKDYLHHLNFQRALAVILRRRAHAAVGFVMAGPGDSDVDELKPVLRLLVPHLMRAVRINTITAQAILRSQAAEAGLDRASNAVLMLKPDLQIVSANSQAKLLADNGTIMLGTRFRFADPRAQARLAELAQRLAPAKASFRAATPRDRSIPVLAVSFPVHSNPVIGGVMLGAGLAVSIGATSRLPMTAPEQLAAWFSLTPAEACLTAALVDGDTLKDYTARRGVSIHAARFLLKGIYRKTGASSQAQLIARLRDLPVQ